MTPLYQWESVPTWQVSLRRRFLDMGEIRHLYEKNSPDHRVSSRRNVAWRPVSLQKSDFCLFNPVTHDIKLILCRRLLLPHTSSWEWWSACHSPGCIYCFMWPPSYIVLITKLYSSDHQKKNRQYDIRIWVYSLFIIFLSIMKIHNPRYMLFFAQFNSRRTHVVLCPA